MASKLQMSIQIYTDILTKNVPRCRRGRYRMVVGFKTTHAISAYHHQICEFEPRSWRGVLDSILCDKVWQ